MKTFILGLFSGCIVTLCITKYISHKSNKAKEEWERFYNMLP